MLTTEIAEMIVKETSARLNRNVNIMSSKGIIIASCDSSRLYHIHEGALEVLRSEQAFTVPMDHEGKWRGAQPGINLPIVFDQQIVGVIGITGNPKEIEDVAGLVKMTTELMVKQSYMASQTEWQQRTKDMIIEDLLNEQPSIEHVLRRLALLKIELPSTLQTLVIELDEGPSLSRSVLIHQLEKAAGSYSCLVGFVHTKRLCIAFSYQKEADGKKKREAVLQVLKLHHFKFRMASSTPFSSLELFHQSYEDCILAFEIGDPKQEVLSFAELEAQALIHQLNPVAADRLSRRVLLNSVLSLTDTLQCFLDHHLNLQQTADSLHIHRNTLIYRLNKIKEETGYDPRKFKDAFALQMALWILEKDQKKKELAHV
ncbi:CdaR family transcriptional regulator [Fictibacillus fluitans]|uniref:Sugar diacid recognition domain-containing protein n=1 Tax=Fictibacillus fluitans TaxID=3058422 RepID=A0ABT8HUQ9_9BACL|nr:sugar diacid recognition domain-containing protein [Fictibacillus sp. NE201]MDN4524225.1 sugar diacid recognition domain-containing protein [Fictibacillus sp. NE201]